MAFKTSFFNTALYGRSIRRLWPIWVSATLIWLFMLTLSVYQQLHAAQYIYSDRVQMLQNLPETLASLVYGKSETAAVFSGIFAALTAMAVYSHLFTAKSANFYHALPVRREALFLSFWSAGMTMVLIPFVVALPLTALIEGVYGYLDPAPLLTVTAIGCGSGVLFFGLASVCAAITGNLLALPVFYLIFNGLVGGMYMISTSLAQTFLLGLSVDTYPASVCWLTPIIKLMDATNLQYDSFSGCVTGVNELSAVAVYAVVGLALAAAALLLFRIRAVESAGDLIAFPVLRPIFQISVAFCFSVCMTTCLQYVLSSGYPEDALPFAATLVLLIVGAFVGWFAAEMLLQKTFRVFHRSMFVRWGVFTAVLLVMAVCLKCDVIGYSSWVPAVEDVQSVSIRYVNGSVETDPADAVALHQTLLDNRDALSSINSNEYYTNTMTFTYTLKSGGTAVRAYNIGLDSDKIETDGTMDQAVYNWFTKPAYIMQRKFGGELTEKRLRDASLNYCANDENGTFSSVSLGSADAWTLYEAVREDILAGRSDSYYWLFGGADDDEPSYELDFDYYSTDGIVSQSQLDEANGYAYLEVTDNMTSTMAALKALGVGKNLGVPALE